MKNFNQAHDFDNHRPSRQARQVFVYSIQNVSRPVRSTRYKGPLSSARDVPTFYGEIKPVMIILRLLGVLPYSTTATGDVCFKWLSIAMFYSLVCIIVVATLVGFTLVERFNLSTYLESSFEDKTIEYAVRLFISSVFIIPTNHWPETAKKMKFINSWTALQAEYKKTTGRKLRLGLHRKVFVSLAISVALVPIFLMMVYLRGLALHWWQYIDFVFAFSVTVLLPSIWIFTCAALTKTATELADDMEKNFSSRDGGKISNISGYRSVWLQLSKLTQDLGNATGLTYGGQTLVLFAISVLLIYGFMVELAVHFNYIFFTSALLYQSIIFAQCNSAHIASNEVGIKFSERLHIIISNMPAANNTDVQEFLSAMVTYLIVLMQFQLTDVTGSSL